MKPIFYKKFAALLLSSSLLFVSACKKGRVDSKIIGGAGFDTGDATTTTTTTTTTTGTVTSYYSGVATTGGTTATAQTGTFPSASGGPTATITAGNTSVIRGGSSQVTITGSSAFQTVYIAASNTTVTAPGVAPASAPDISGYYQITLPSAVTTVTIVVTASQSLSDTSFNFVVSVANAAGQVGTPDNEAVTAITTVGTGDVQVSLSWNSVVDMDLYVVDPSNEEIYYGDKTAASGGTLDLDSNVSCSGPQNENVTWPSGTAPNGTYIVRVNLYGACSVTSATSITVTVTARGTTKTFTGTRGPTATPASGGGGTEVTRFTVSSTGVTFAAPSLAQGPAQPGTK